MATFKAPLPDNGIARVRSPFSVDETVRRIEALLRSKGLNIFAFVDHSGEAEKAGLRMRPTKVIIFGNPKGGTPLMVAAPSLAIDLPLKALIAEDDAGNVWISYNTPQYLQQRHSIPTDLMRNIDGIGGLLQKSLE
jgi:uncharacterized protein (DUF302 family)